ncbi:response regulator [Steroidobacter sp. S1-65]|uniref:Response regulator n=1 Tax=Steroidobacter gossypii TaxID=2805490 RepID=A0ABS1WVD9_9GAMM|nr:HD domain-containing phosphohydrolase [Steroidobacter gossypii]MBM0104937.1 response regulator [Steroidobacter gossypii]
MSEQKQATVVCVDDEARVVEGLALHLRRDYQVHTALSGDEGLRKLQEIGGAAVVVSDMRMPGMDGATFLRKVMRSYPDATRILLTGEPGRDAAVLAINEGQIFRFLTKPCPPDRIKAAVEAGVIQHRLMNAERLLMQETLIGCIQALLDVLAIANPVAFGRASRIKRLAMNFAEALSIPGFWQLEAAAMLSQIGYLSLPVETVEKVYYGERLTPEEEVLVSAAPEVAMKLLGHIPRLEPVLQILMATQYSEERLKKLGDGTIGQGARILLIVLGYDALLTQGHSTEVAVQTLRTQAARFGAELLEKFAALIGSVPSVDEVQNIPLRHVRPGMTILTDVRTHMGTLLIPRGFEVSETFLERLRNLGSSLLAEKVKVLVQAAKPVELKPEEIR